MGSINIPDDKFEQMKDQLPQDKSMLLIYYCEGPECVLSHNSARKAEALGYTNVKVYTNGYPEWVAKGEFGAVAGAYVKKLIDEKASYMLVDSRPKRVVDKDGMIPTAVHISDSEFDKHTDKLPADKATELIFYCGGLECPLSPNSAEKARKLGYTNVKTYALGHPDWLKLYGAPKAAAAPAAAGGAAKAGVKIETGQGEGLDFDGMVRARHERESGRAAGDRHPRPEGVRGRHDQGGGQYSHGRTGAENRLPARGPGDRVHLLHRRALRRSLRYRQVAARRFERLFSRCQGALRRRRNL